MPEMGRKLGEMIIVDVSQVIWSILFSHIFVKLKELQCFANEFSAATGEVFFTEHSVVFQEFIFKFLDSFHKALFKLVDLWTRVPDNDLHN